MQNQKLQPVLYSTHPLPAPEKRPGSVTSSASKRHFISPSQRAEIRAAIARDPERLAERYIPAGLVRLGRRGRETEWNVSRKKRGGGNGRFRILHDGDNPLFSDFTHSPALAGRGVNFITRAEGLPTGETWRAYQIAAEIYGIETGLEAEAAVPAHIREKRRAQIEADKQAAKEAKKAAEQLEREAHAAAADAARAILDASQPATSHPYADRKAISCAGLFVATRTIRARLYSPTKGEWLPQAVAANKGDLIVPAYDAAGNLINAQKIAANGTKRPIEGGQMRGTVHIIPGIEPGFIVEGYATGATVHQATGRMVAVAFNAGGLPVVAPRMAGRITAVAADNDQSETGRKEAEKTGLPFFMPPDIGTDWNDCAASRGLDYVRDALALPEPPKPLPPVTVAREELRQTVREWLSEGWHESPVMVIPADVGTGKTAAAITEILKDRESDTSAAPVVFAFTSHDLATEKADAIRSEFPDLTVRVWNGRGRTVEGRPMCENIKTVEIYQSAKKSVTDELCYKRGKCPHQDGCPYLKQAKSKADVWIVTHAILQSGPPPKAIGTPAVLVVDESFFSSLKFGGGAFHKADALRWTAPSWAGWLNSQEGAEVRDRCSRIAAMLEQAEGDYLTDADLRPAYLFTEHKTGNLTRFLSDEAKTALAQTEGFIGKVQQATRDDVEKIKEIAPIVVALTRVCAIIREVIERLQAGQSEMPRISLRTEEGERKFRLSGAKKINEAWLAKTVGEEKQPIPALFLDATAEPEIILLAVPDAKIMPQAKAATPHARHVWIKDNAWGFRRMKEAVEAHRAGLKGRRDAQTIEGLRDQVWRRWLEAGCPAYDGKNPTGLVVIPKVVEDYISGAFPGFLPPGFGFLHHGNVAGFNSFERVRVLLVFGRNLQSTGDYEADAVSLTGQWPSPRVQAESYSDAQGVERESNRLPKKTVRRTLPDGRIASVPLYTHPDPLCAAMIREKVDGGIVQAVGRGRAVNRTADNPLSVFVYADTYPEGLPLDAVETAAVLDVPERMALAAYLGEITLRGKAAPSIMPVLSSPIDAAKAYPEMFEKDGKKDREKASRNAFSRSVISASYLYKNIFIGLRGGNQSAKNGGPWRFLAYKPEGRGQSRRYGLFPADWNDQTVTGWLAFSIGETVQIVADGVSPDAPPPPSGPKSRPAVPTVKKQQEAPQPTPRQIVEIERVEALSGFIPEVGTTTPEVVPRPVRDVFARRPVSWQAGGIDRAATGCLRPEAWQTGHEMGAEDECFDPALQWLQEQVRRQGGYAGRCVT